MTAMEEYLKRTVAAMQEAKRAASIEPDHVTDAELYGLVMADVRKALNTLYTEGEIETGRTLNGWYIRLKG